MSAPTNALEIREALEAHAQFDDTAALARLGSVKHRVRVVRRRRRAALAGAAAAVVIAAGGVATLLPGHDDAAPASRTFGHLVAPATMTSAGATYRFDRMATGAGKVSIADTGDQPTLVTWATAGAATATIDQHDGESYTSAADFDDFRRIYGAEGAKVTATADGKVALALYTLSEPAAGARADIDGTQVVFRDEVPGLRPIDSVWGEPGQTDVTMTLTYPERTLELTSFCTGAPDYDLHVDVEGPGSWGACDNEPSVEGPGDRTGFTGGITRQDGSVVKPGERVTVHLWLSRKGSDEPVPGRLAGVRMGAGAYEAEPTVATMGQWSLTELREEAGHTYRFVRLLSADASGRAFATDVDATGRPGLLAYTAGPEASMVRTWFDGEEQARNENSIGGGTFLSTVGPFAPGHHALRLRASVPTTFGVALYEQVD
jgi:hypothetical protein